MRAARIAVPCRTPTTRRSVGGSERARDGREGSNALPRIEKVRLPDGEHDAIEVDFEIAREDWNDYRLADGGRVRVKVVVSKVFRVLDAEGKPANQPNGEPFLVIRHVIQVAASD